MITSIVFVVLAFNLVVTDVAVTITTHRAPSLVVIALLRALSCGCTDC